MLINVLSFLENDLFNKLVVVFWFELDLDVDSSNADEPGLSSVKSFGFFCASLGLVQVKVHVIDNHLDQLLKVKGVKLVLLVYSHRHEAGLNHQDHHGKQVRHIDDDLNHDPSLYFFTPLFEHLPLSAVINSIELLDLVSHLLVEVSKQVHFEEQTGRTDDETQIDESKGNFQDLHALGLTSHSTVVDLSEERAQEREEVHHFEGYQNCSKVLGCILTESEVHRIFLKHLQHLVPILVHLVCQVLVWL